MFLLKDPSDAARADEAEGDGAGRIGSGSRASRRACSNSVWDNLAPEEDKREANDDTRDTLRSGSVGALKAETAEEEASESPDVRRSETCTMLAPLPGEEGDCAKDVVAVGCSGGATG